MSSSQMLFPYLPFALLNVTVLVIAIGLRNIPAKGWLVAYAATDLAATILKVVYAQISASDPTYLLHSIILLISTYSIFCLGFFFLGLWCKSRMATPFHRILFSFSGRMPRSVFWLIILLQTYLGASQYNVLMTRFDLTFLDDRNLVSDWPLWAMAGLSVPFALWLTLASQVKRWHDCNKSGWLVLLSFFPFVGALITILLGLVPGSRGANLYGKNPRLASSEWPTSDPEKNYGTSLVDTPGGV